MLINDLDYNSTFYFVVVANVTSLLDCVETWSLIKYDQ